MSRLLFFTKTFRFFLFLSGCKRGAAARILPNPPPPILRRTPEILPNRLSRVPCLVGVERIWQTEKHKKAGIFLPLATAESRVMVMLGLVSSSPPYLSAPTVSVIIPLFPPKKTSLFPSPPFQLVQEELGSCSLQLTQSHEGSSQNFWKEILFVKVPAQIRAGAPPHFSPCPVLFSSIIMWEI